MISNSNHADEREHILRVTKKTFSQKNLQEYQKSNNILERNMESITILFFFSTKLFKLHISLYFILRFFACFLDNMEDLI